MIRIYYVKQKNKYRPKNALALQPKPASTYETAHNNFFWFSLTENQIPQ